MAWYITLNQKGDRLDVFTWLDDQGVERVQSYDFYKTSLYGVDAPLEHSWELAIKGRDSLKEGIEQTWVQGFSQAERFNPLKYAFCLGADGLSDKEARQKFLQNFKSLQKDKVFLFPIS
jgi:hypothetical protein